MIEEYNYWNDRRVQESMIRNPYKVLESNDRVTKVISEEDFFEALVEEGVDVQLEMELSTRYEVCHSCRGSGTVVNPSIDAGGISREDFDEDPEFARSYFNGDYNIRCTNCKGKRVVPEVDFPSNIQKEIDSWMEDQWDYVRESCAERAMGA